MTVSSKVKQTLASLEGAKGILRTYANQGENEKTKAIFVEAVQKLEEITEDLEKRVQQLEWEEPQYKGY